MADQQAFGAGPRGRAEGAEVSLFGPDIVARLKESGGELELEAARRIERLRAELETVRGLLSDKKDEGYRQCQRDIRVALGIDE